MKILRETLAYMIQKPISVLAVQSVIGDWAVKGPNFSLLCSVKFGPCEGRATVTLHPKLAFMHENLMMITRTDHEPW